jgi:hypothetical protein
MIKDSNGGHITDPVGKANNLNNYYASVLGNQLHESTDEGPTKLLS